MALVHVEYILESEEESNRLANQHDVIKDEMVAYYSHIAGCWRNSVEMIRKILSRRQLSPKQLFMIRDLGRSTVRVQCEFARTDLNASNFPANPPPGQTYLAQDIIKPWPAAQQVLQNLATLMKPEGWIQLIKATNVLPEGDGPAMRNFVAVMKGVFSSFGASLKLGDGVPGLREAAGFEDVQDRLANTKLGAANSDLQLAKQGTNSTTVASKGLAKLGSSLPEGTIPLSAAQLQSIPDELTAELPNKGAIYPSRILWGASRGCDLFWNHNYSIRGGWDACLLTTFSLTLQASSTTQISTISTI